MKPDQLRVHSLLVDTVTLLCRNGLNYHKVLRIQGTIGITVDDADVFLVHINDAFDNSTGDQQVTAPKSPQRTVYTGVGTKSVNGQLRPSSTEQKTEIQGEINDDMVDNAQPLDNPLSFPVQQASKTDDSSYLSNSDSSYLSNSGGSVDFNQTKIEPKYEADNDDDDDVVFVSPEDVPADCFSQGGNHMEQTQADSQQWKHGRHQEVRKEYPTRRRMITRTENSALHVEEYEQKDYTVFSSQQIYQQTMFQPHSSYIAADGELSSYLNNSYSVHADAVDSSDSTGDVGDLMPVDNLQQSFFGDSNHDTSQGNQNFATMEVPQRSRKRTASDQPQRKGNPGTQSQQIPRDSWATVTATKFLCKMCGNSFNHRPSLLAHQINKHGRPKNRRGRPPTQLIME